MSHRQKIDHDGLKRATAKKPARRRNEMNIDLNTVLQAAAKPLNGFVSVTLLVLAAYLADCYFNKTARR